MASPIKVQILGDAKGLQTALGQAQAQLKAFGLASNKGKLLAGGAATAIVGLGIAAGKMALDMDQAKKDFELSTGLVGEAADDAFQQVLDAAGQVPDALDAVVEAGGNLSTTTGFLGEDLENLTVQFLDLNRLGFGALNENQVGEMFNTWGLEGENATKALDNLAQVSQATGVDIGMLSDLVTSNAGAFMKWGLDAEEAVQMLGQWEKAGIDSNKVVRGLNSNIDMLESQGKDTAKMLEEMTQVMDDGNISAEEATLLYDLFGAEATDVIAQLEAGTISLKDFDTQMGMSGQSVQDMTNASATVGEKFAELRNKIMVKLGPALVRLGELLIQVVDWFIEDALPAIEKFSQDAVELFQDIYDKVKPILDGIWEYLQGVIKIIEGIWEAFSSAFRGDWKGFWEGIKKIFTGIWKSLKGIFRTYWNSFKLYVQGVLTVFRQMFGGVINNIVDFFKNLPGRARSAAASGMRTLRDWFLGRARDIKDKAVAIFEKVVDWFRSLPGKARRAFGNGFQFLADTMRGAINKVIGAWNRVDTNIDIRVPGWVPGIGGKGFTVPDIFPDIPYLQHGGTASGFAVVGEAGPELIRMPLGGGSVESARDAFGPGASTTNNVTVNVHSNATPEEIASAVVWQMRRAG